MLPCLGLTIYSTLLPLSFYLSLSPPPLLRRPSGDASPAAQLLKLHFSSWRLTGTPLVRVDPPRPNLNMSRERALPTTLASHASTILAGMGTNEKRPKPSVQQVKKVFNPIDMESSFKLSKFIHIDGRKVRRSEEMLVEIGGNGLSHGDVQAVTQCMPTTSLGARCWPQSFSRVYRA